MGPINAEELLLRQQNGEKLNLLDVRENIEFHTWNIGGINIPLPKFEAGIGGLAYNKTDEIIVICKAGLRSQTAQSILTANGYTKARNLTGGLLGLQKLNKKLTHD